MVYYSINNKKVMIRAVQSSSLFAELSERLIDDIKISASWIIKQMMINIITNKDNYNERAWHEWDSEEFNLNEVEKAENIITWIYEISSEMLQESTDFNKGYQKPRSTEWNEVVTNSLSRKDLYIFIDPSINNPLKIKYFDDIQNLGIVNLKEDFGGVFETKLPNNVKIVIRDINSLAYTVISEEGIDSETIKPSGSTKFYFKSTIYSRQYPFCKFSGISF